MSTLLIIGLGNPGAEYARTKHNVGFMVIDQLARRLDGDWHSGKWLADSIETNWQGTKVCLLKPHTFMNLSGQSVSQAAAYFKLTASDVWTISDDIDLPLGRVRVRGENYHGGHNGLRSIDEALGSSQYGHIRVGINDPNRQIDTAEYVLEPFSERQQRHLDKVITRTVEIIDQSIGRKELKAHTYNIDETG